jgi:cytidine deaminase
MRDASKQRLIAAAMKARLRAVAPYSRFRVGAALLASSGRIYSGINVESASFGLSCCAERVALFKALSEGERQFEAMAVVAAFAEGPTPCGACRQLLVEYAPLAVVFTADSRRPRVVRQFEVKQLLPMAFTLNRRNRKQDDRKM